MPEPPLIKICGLTEPAEAAACAALGVWAIGVVFAEESPRRVGVERARQVLAGLPAAVRRVGLFVDADPHEVAAAARTCGLTHVQLHGPADVERCRELSGCEVIQAFAVSGPGVLDEARRSDADLVLLDASVPGRHGGTGTSFDWRVLEAADLGRPFALAGGLDASNVAEAVRRTAPAIVDVSSGVESAPGRKDPARVAAFVSAARAAVAAGSRS